MEDIEGLDQFLFFYLCLIRLIQEEKESTEQRADELEIRVGSGSLAGGTGGWRGPSMGGGMMGVCYERSTSPPLLVASSSSGRSTPTAHGQHPTRSSPYGAASQSSRDGMQKYHTVSGSSTSKAEGMGRGVRVWLQVDVSVWTSDNSSWSIVEGTEGSHLLKSSFH